MTTDSSQALALAGRLAASYAAWPAVEAVALGGSRATGLADPGSDVDLYVYAAAEPGDEWADGGTGLGVDVMFRTPAFIEDELDRVLVRHEARAGYSTCLWHNVLTSRPLFDRRGFYAALQARAGASYPEPLRRAVVARNLPLLQSARSSFGHQLARAEARGDGVAVNHRSAAFLASAFDVLFALNRAPHPGEKQILAHLRGVGLLLPPGLDAQVAALLSAASQPGAGAARAAEALAESITALCQSEGLLP